MTKKIAYVTGGMGGIGTSICQKLHQDGCLVIAGCGPNSPRKDRWLSEQKALGYDFHASEGNVGDWTSTVAAFNKVRAEIGTVDILVNNAGITRDAALKNMTFTQWQQVIDVNLSGVFQCTKSISPYMVAQQSGRIINAASVVAHNGSFGQSNYVAAKAGVIGLTKVWARELGSKGITVNAVAPGFIETEMTAVLGTDFMDELLKRTPVRRIGQPIDIANAYLFLASDKTSFINGTCLNVDGGLTL